MRAGRLSSGAPYGALVDLARDLISGKTDVFGAADRLRSWQI